MDMQKDVVKIATEREVERAKETKGTKVNMIG